MNVLMILLDSLNRDYLSCYGNYWIKTPNIQRLAERSVVFDNHFIGSAPCIPARRGLFSGRKEFLWRGWGQAEPFDNNIAAMARELGAYTAIATDHSHYWDRSYGYGYIEPFEDREMIRGQEGDSVLAPQLQEGQIPEWVRSMARYWPLNLCLRYYRNVMHFQGEEDFHCARVMSAGARALANCAQREKSFVLIESFDPHEPWYVPEPYRSMYGVYREDFTCWAPYLWQDRTDRFFQEATSAEMDFLRQQYAGNVSMVDNQLGKVLRVIDEKNLWDDTVVILTTDHGHELADHRCFGKSYPHWSFHANIPLIIWHPDYPGPARHKGFSTMVDIHSTIMELLGAEGYTAPHGRSLLPLLSGEEDAIQDSVLYGSYGLGACLTDSEFTFFSGYNNNLQLPNWHSTMMERNIPTSEAICGRFIPDVEMPVWRFPRPCKFDHHMEMPPQIFAREDTAQHNDLSENTSLLSRCRRRLRAAMDEEISPPEQYRRLLLEE